MIYDLLVEFVEKSETLSYNFYINKFTRIFTAYFV